MRDAGGLLLRALLDAAGDAAGGEAGACCLAAHSVAWASATITGARHQFTLALHGADATARAAAIETGIATMEFALPGHLVADAACVARRATSEGVEVDLEALTVEEA
jgi:hypothetical protein